MSKSKVLFYHRIFVSNHSLFCILYLYKGYFDYFLVVFFIISVSYNVSGHIMLVHSNSICVRILVLEQPCFTFWLLSCCNASSCTYQFESSMAHLCMKIAELIKRVKPWNIAEPRLNGKPEFPPYQCL